MGVLPAEASFPDAVRLWLPRAGDPAQPYESYSGDAIGRLKPGVTVAQADADLKRAHQPIWDASDKDHTVTPFVTALHDTFVRDYRGAAKTVGGAVAVLLLIACANVAAVMLARALARRREMGIRLALGSSRMRLLRQLLIENLMLSVSGWCHRARRRPLGAGRLDRHHSRRVAAMGGLSDGFSRHRVLPCRRRRGGDPVRMGASPARRRRRSTVGGERLDQRHDGRAARPPDAVGPGGRRVRPGGHPARVRDAVREGLRSRPSRRSRLPRRQRARRDDSAVRRDAAETRTVGDILGRSRTARVADSRRRRRWSDLLRTDGQLSPGKFLSGGRRDPQARWQGPCRPHALRVARILRRDGHPSSRRPVPAGPRWPSQAAHGGRRERNVRADVLGRRRQRGRPARSDSADARTTPGSPWSALPATSSTTASSVRCGRASTSRCTWIRDRR